MDTICMAVFCIGLFALLGFKGTEARGERKLRGQGACRAGSGNSAGAENSAGAKNSAGAENLAAAQGEDRTGESGRTMRASQADLERLFRGDAGTGRAPLELDYGDESRIVFHGYFGLVVCEKGTSWKVLRTLDLAALGAAAMEGDDYTVIDAGRERARILPGYFLPGKKNPEIYCYDYGEGTLREERDYRPVRDDRLSWGYTQSMPVQEKADRLLGTRGLSRCSNVYPVLGIGGGEYGFLAAEKGRLESLCYGVYREKGEELELSDLFRSVKQEKRGEKG